VKRLLRKNICFLSYVILEDVFVVKFAICCKRQLNCFWAIEDFEVEILPKDLYGDSLSDRGLNNQSSNGKADSLPLTYC